VCPECRNGPSLVVHGLLLTQEDSFPEKRPQRTSYLMSHLISKKAECQGTDRLIKALQQAQETRATWVKSEPLPVFINKVLLEHSHTCLFAYCLGLLP
jgi:NADH:ubiquinone oxidoreductase subunit E